MHQPALNELKGIVFDLDGTLIDSHSMTFDAFNHGIMTLGGRRHTPQEIMAHFGAGELKIFERIIGSEHAEAAYEACVRYMDENVGMAPLFEGAGELLDSLKSAAVPISIFTGRGWNTTEMILKHHRILDRFVTVVADDHVNCSKPSPEGLLLALKRMNLDPHQVLMVGDSPHDMRAAHSAGAYGVAALWDYMANRELLASLKPHHWAEKPNDVLEIWRRLQQ